MEGKAQNNSGANQLTNTLMHMMTGIANEASKTQLDFGIINSDYSLTTNSFPCPIPKDHYNVCRQLLYDPSVPLTETYEDGSHRHPEASPPGTHSHKVKLPPKMYHLRPGNKVLVAIVQNEFVVIDRIYDAKWLGVSEPTWD